MLPLIDGAQGQLPILERKLICLVVSAANGCSYCQIFHIDGLGKVHLSGRERALADLSVKITQDAHTVEPEDFDRLRALGLSDNEILEAVEVAALINATNTFCIALGVPIDMELFD